MKTFDVVIVGAGLAGLQCANLLSRQGAKVLLVDHKANLTKGIHTTGIFVRKTLEDFQFPVGSLGNVVKDITLYSPNLRTINSQSEKAEFRVGKMGFLYKSLLKECEKNGVEFLNKTRYVSAEILRGESIVKLEKSGKNLEVETKVLVGADGANSRVAKDLKLHENKEWIVGYEEVFCSKNLSRKPRLHCFLDAKLAPGYLAWIADDGDEMHVGVGGYAEDFNPRESLKRFKEKTTEIAGFGDAELLETRGGRIPVGGVLQKIANQNGLLIGDAAGAVSPLTAGGLDPCLRLSKFAAEVILERLKTDDAQFLLNYSGKIFRARFISRLWMRRILKTLSNQTLLNIGFSLLNNKIGEKFARHVFFGRGSFPNVELKIEAKKKLKFS